MAPCDICDDEITTKNPIFICVRCDVKVHKLCYGAEGSSNNWKCSPCRLNMSNVKCKLCSQKSGAMKQTNCDNWVHVICGLFTQGVVFSDANTMEPVNIKNVPRSLKGKVCSICNSKKGFCTTCAETDCNKKIHVTCAQAENALKEVVDPDNNSISFEAYCVDHKPSGSNRRLSSGSVQDKKRKMTSKSNNSITDADWILESNGHSTPASSAKKRHSK